METAITEGCGMNRQYDHCTMQSNKEAPLEGGPGVEFILGATLFKLEIRNTYPTRMRPDQISQNKMLLIADW